MRKDNNIEFTIERLRNHQQELIDLLYLLQCKFNIVHHTDNPYDFAFCCGQQSVIEEIRSLIR